MLYLTLNQAFKNVINNEVPDDVMKIIYQYVIGLNNKIKINNLFDIFNYDYKYEKEIKQKNVKQLQVIYNNLSQRCKISFLKDIKNSGKKNKMVKQDYIDKICYAKYWNGWFDKIDDLKDDKISHYNVNTKKCITRDEHREIRNKYEQDYKDDLKRHMTLFQQTHPQYNISMIDNDIYYGSMEISRYALIKMNDNYKRHRASKIHISVKHSPRDEKGYAYYPILSII